MKHIVITLAAIICLCLFSCKEAEMYNDSVYKINLDNAKDIDIVYFSDFFDSGEITILETNEASLLRGVTKLINVDNNLYIFDLRSKTVSQFSSDGTFVRRYGFRGSGPGEYTDISDFTIDKKNRQLYIFDNQAQKIICYELESGKFLKDFRINNRTAYYSRFFTLVGDRMYSDIYYNPSNDKKEYVLQSFDIKDPGDVNYYLEKNSYLSGWNNYSQVGLNTFFYNGNNDYCVMANRFSNQIVKIDADGVSNYINVKSKDFMGEKERKELSGPLDAKTQLSSPGRDAVDEMNKYYGMREYFETSDYVSFKLLKGLYFKMVLYDKKNGESSIIKVMEDDLLLKRGNLPIGIMSRFLYANEDGVFFYIQSEMLDKLKLAAQEGLLVDGIGQLEELKNLPEDSNPIIIYYKFK